MGYYVESIREIKIDGNNNNNNKKKKKKKKREMRLCNETEGYRSRLTSSSEETTDSRRITVPIKTNISSLTSHLNIIQRHKDLLVERVPYM
jgi:Holliday junction resolvase RusA-like endonuclease